MPAARWFLLARCGEFGIPVEAAIATNVIEERRGLDGLGHGFYRHSTSVTPRTDCDTRTGDAPLVAPDKDTGVCPQTGQRQPGLEWRFVAGLGELFRSAKSKRAHRWLVPNQIRSATR
jgi:hypothetical protein